MVWLKVRPEEAIRRMGESRAQRPLLNRVNPTGELHRLLTEREPVYKSADVSINTEMYSLARIVERIELLASEAAQKA
jgi:shikimate kinase